MEYWWSNLSKPTLPEKQIMSILHRKCIERHEKSKKSPRFFWKTSYACQISKFLPVTKGTGDVSVPILCIDEKVYSLKWQELWSKPTGDQCIYSGQVVPLVKVAPKQARVLCQLHPASLSSRTFEFKTKRRKESCFL